MIFRAFLDLVVSAMLLSFLNHLVGLACRSLCSKTVLASSFSVSTRVLIVLVSAATLSFLCQILRSFLCRPSLNQHLFDGDRVVDEFSSQEPLGSCRHFASWEHLVSYSSPSHNPNDSNKEDTNNCLDCTTKQILKNRLYLKAHLMHQGRQRLENVQGVDGTSGLFSEIQHLRSQRHWMRRDNKESSSSSRWWWDDMLLYYERRQQQHDVIT